MVVREKEDSGQLEEKVEQNTMPLCEKDALKLGLHFTFGGVISNAEVAQ